MITRENINGVIAAAGFSGPIGLLHIDIDGNDYWVWKAINIVQPTIVIVEYNSVFGSKYAVSVPYDPTFNRTQAHYSNLFWGASLKAYCQLANEKGYSFVGSNSAGNNAYFVKTECLGDIRAVDVETGYVESKYRESRNADGQLTYLQGSARYHEISDQIVIDLDRNLRIALRDLIQED
jgi:hypothetical protein